VFSLSHAFHLDARDWVTVVFTIETPCLLKAFTFVERDRAFISIEDDGPRVFADLADANTEQFVPDAFAVMSRVYI
jgi:hypothetical protein